MLFEEQLDIVVVLDRVLGVEAGAVAVERLAIIVTEPINDRPRETISVASISL